MAICVTYRSLMMVAASTGTSTMSTQQPLTMGMNVRKNRPLRQASSQAPFRQGERRVLHHNTVQFLTGAQTWYLRFIFHALGGSHGLHEITYIGLLLQNIVIVCIVGLLDLLLARVNIHHVCLGRNTYITALPTVMCTS